MELTTTINNLIVSESISNLASKVEGRRNWVIRIHTKFNHIYYAGGYGQARRYGMMEAYLQEISNCGVIWLEFTYKKDYLQALEKLQALGYEM